MIKHKSSTLASGKVNLSFCVKQLHKACTTNLPNGKTCWAYQYNPAIADFRAKTWMIIKNHLPMLPSDAYPKAFHNEFIKASEAAVRHLSKVCPIVVNYKDHYFAADDIPEQFDFSNVSSLADTKFSFTLSCNIKVTFCLID